MNARIPSLDAAAHIGDRIRAAEAAALRQYEDLAAARAAVAAIKAIPAIDLTPKVLAQIVAACSARLSTASWSHFDDAEVASKSLDDAVDSLIEAGRE